MWHGWNGTRKKTIYTKKKSAYKSLSEIYFSTPTIFSAQRLFNLFFKCFINLLFKIFLFFKFLFVGCMMLGDSIFESLTWGVKKLKLLLMKLKSTEWSIVEDDRYKSGQWYKNRLDCQYHIQLALKALRFVWYHKGYQW